MSQPFHVARTASSSADATVVVAAGAAVVVLAVGAGAELVVVAANGVVGAVDDEAVLVAITTWALVTGVADLCDPPQALAPSAHSTTRAPAVNTLLRRITLSSSSSSAQR